LSVICMILSNSLPATGPKSSAFIPFGRGIAPMRASREKL
jgi:hypothetical protein